MATYAVLIYGDETAELSEAEGKAEMDAYEAYTAMLAGSNAAPTGEALHPTSTATTVRVRDGQTLTTDGPFMETKEVLGGFYVIHADDLDAAIGLAARCPGALRGSVEVRPVVDFSQPG